MKDHLRYHTADLKWVLQTFRNKIWLFVLGLLFATKILLVILQNYATVRFKTNYKGGSSGMHYTTFIWQTYLAAYCQTTHAQIHVAIKLHNKCYSTMHLPINYTLTNMFAADKYKDEFTSLSTWQLILTPWDSIEVTLFMCIYNRWILRNLVCINMPIQLWNEQSIIYPYTPAQEPALQHAIQ